MIFVPVVLTDKVSKATSGAVNSILAETRFMLSLSVMLTPISRGTTPSSSAYSIPVDSTCKIGLSLT